MLRSSSLIFVCLERIVAYLILPQRRVLVSCNRFKSFNAEFTRAAVQSIAHQRKASIRISAVFFS